MAKIKTLEITSNLPIKFSEITLFRGAVIDSLENKDILFHNHKEEGFRYSYPLIQYKRINGNAAIVCVDKGTEAIGEWFSSKNSQINLGERTVSLEIESMKAYMTDVQCVDTYIYYHISNWLPLNSENYSIYTKSDGLIERMEILQKVLAGNIMSFLKGVDIYLEQQISVIITKISRESIIEYKGVKLMNFYADFKTNLWLPNHIGLGKGASSGFGTIMRLKETNNI